MPEYRPSKIRNVNINNGEPFKQLGLDGRAVSVYWAMLRQARADAAEVAAATRLPDGVVCEAIARLREFGLLHDSREFPGSYIAATPRAGLTALLADRREALAREERALAAVEVAAVTFADEAERMQQRLPFCAELLEGIDVIRSRLADLAVGAREELLSMSPGGPQTPETIAASQPLDERMLRRGVRMRSVFLDSVPNERNSRKWVEWLASLGAETRSVPVLPVRLKIYDRRVAVVQADVGSTEVRAAQIEIPGVVQGLVALFEHVWESAQPFGAGARPDGVPDDDVPSAQERELLALLAEGFTDEGVARKLGVSVRTVRRSVAGLMRRLNAQSRFQAAVHAAERGWVRPSNRLVRD